MFVLFLVHWLSTVTRASLAAAAQSRNTLPVLDSLLKTSSGYQRCQWKVADAWYRACSGVCRTHRFLCCMNEGWGRERGREVELQPDLCELQAMLQLFLSLPWATVLWCLVWRTLCWCEGVNQERTWLCLKLPLPRKADAQVGVHASPHGPAFEAQDTDPSPISPEITDAETSHCPKENQQWAFLCIIQASPQVRKEVWKYPWRASGKEASLLDWPGHRFPRGRLLCLLCPLSEPGTNLLFVWTWQSCVYLIRRCQSSPTCNWELEFPDGFPGGPVVKNPPVMQETWVQCLGQNDSLEEEMATHPGKSHGQRSLAGYSPWGRKELDITEWACTHSESQVCPPGESSSGYEEGSETPGSSSPSHAFQKSDHALWPFCALASAPLKDKKAAAPDFPSHPLWRTKGIILLALLRGDKQCQWKPLPTGEQFLFTYVMPPPAEMLAAPWPSWAIRRECHRVWLPPSAKRTDLLPALRTNPLPEVSPGTGSQIFPFFFFKWGRVVG